MSTPGSERRFQRLRRESPPGADHRQVPADGLCLSAFLIVSPPGRPGEVLLGRVDPSQPWSRLGGLDGERLRTVAGQWMLPSSHLLEYEEPVAAARRIAAEQLELAELKLRGPEVRSEAYHRGRTPPDELHWDLHFLFRGAWPEGRLLRARPFTELRFFPGEALPAEGVARGGADIIRLAGLPLGPAAAEPVGTDSSPA